MTPEEQLRRAVSATPEEQQRLAALAAGYGPAPAAPEADRMILEPGDRPDRTVWVRVGDEVVVVHPDGRVDLPVRLTGMRPRQVVELLRRDALP